MSDDMPMNKIIILALFGIALAMGVAVIVLPLLEQAVDISLVGVAIFCLGLAGLIQISGK